MTVGDTGTAISLNAGGYNMTGLTATLLAAPGDFSPPNTLPPPNALSFTCTVQPGGLTAVYTTTGTDFTSGGEWTFWLRAEGGGSSFTSEPGLVYIYPAPLKG